MNRFLIQCCRVFPLGELFGHRLSPRELLNTLISLFGACPPRRSAAIEPTPSRRQREFDIDYETGFLPNRPLPRLSDRYLIWEQGLSLAQEQLSLGEDESDDAVEKRSSGEALL